MFNLRTVLDFIGSDALIKEPPINSIWQEYHVGVNLTQVDCFPDDEKCFIERFNNDNIDKANVITIGSDERQVKIVFK